MSKGTTARNIRLSDELWEAMLRKAEQEGRSVSEAIREWAAKWVMKPPRKPQG